MPNYCSNRLTITGDETEVSSLCSFVSNYVAPDAANSWRAREASLCARLAPPPSAVTDHPDWEVFSDWADSHWGTSSRGDLNTVVMEREPGVVVFFFLTAWSPPLAAIYSAAVDWPALCFEAEYCEVGMGFMGRYFFHQPEPLTEDEIMNRWFGDDDTAVDDGSDKAWWAEAQAASALIHSGSMRRHLT